MNAFDLLLAQWSQQVKEIFPAFRAIQKSEGEEERRREKRNDEADGRERTREKSVRPRPEKLVVKDMHVV